MVTRYDIQWCAQFYVCAELTRREYLVALTLGNAQETDIFVSSPSGRNFRIDVKGQSTKNFWRFREKSPLLHFILRLNRTKIMFPMFHFTTFISKIYNFITIFPSLYSITLYM